MAVVTSRIAPKVWNGMNVNERKRTAPECDDLHFCSPPLSILHLHKCLKRLHFPYIAPTCVHLRS
jgi:hypothetical protein